MKKNYSVIPVTYYRVNVNGRTTCYSKYEEIGYGYAKVMKNGKWGILTPDGNIWGRIEYSSISTEFNENMLLVEKDGKYGYADIVTGRFIECIFEYAGDFKYGRAIVKQNGKYHIINTLGKFID